MGQKWVLAGSIGYYGREVAYSGGSNGLSMVSSGEGDWVYTYNSSGKVESLRNLRAELTKFFSYDYLGRLTRIRHEATGGEIVHEVNYTLSIDGKRLGKRVRRAGAAQEDVWSFAYDPLGRLVSERRDVENDGIWDLDRSFEYNPDGGRTRIVNNIDQQPVQLITYIPNAQGFDTHQIESVTENSETATYHWDDAGRLARRVYEGGVEDTFAWDPAGRLLRATTRDSLSVEYTYNHRGDRVRREVLDSDGAVLADVRYLTDKYNPTGRTQVLAEVDGATGSVLRTYTYGDTLLASTEFENGEARTVSYLGDGVGTVEGEWNSESDVAEFHESGTFGEEAEADSFETASLFAGESHDGATGLNYHRHRWYDGTTGRFLSPDPVYDFPGNFGSTYGYAGQDPVLQTDPTGLFTLGELVVVLAKQVILHQIIIPNVMEFLMQAAMTALGVDPNAILGTVTGAFVGMLGLDAIASYLGAIMPTGLLELSETMATELEQLNEVLRTIATIISIATLVIEGIQTLVAIFQFVFSRSLANGLQLFETVYQFLMSIRQLHQPGEVSYNPHIDFTVGEFTTRFFKADKEITTATPSQVHHSATYHGKWGKLFRAMFDYAGKNVKNSESNLSSITGHQGRHPDIYHAWVFHRLCSTFKFQEVGPRGLQVQAAWPPIRKGRGKI